MSKFCSKCGKEMNDDSFYCPGCGANTELRKEVLDRPNLPYKNIVTCILLTIVTCGIYGLYWFIIMTDEANSISDEQTASGGMALLYTIITCGIYGIYWNYKMGQKMYNAGKKYDLPISDNSIIYLILSIFGFGIVNYCLIQSDLNRFSK